MNCKFHPTAEAVTKCAVCGAELCLYCDQKAFFRSEDEDKKPFCLNCSLKEAKIKVAAYEEYLLLNKKRNRIALILWIAGLLLLIFGIGIVFMIAASIVYNGKALIASEEQTFSEKIKATLLTVLICTITCPFDIIKDSGRNKKEIKKFRQKLQDILVVVQENAEQGDAVAQYNLGELYFDGNGVTKNYEKAFELWGKAAEQGYTDALCRLGVAYNEGEGVPQDYGKSVEYFTKAASLGSAFAQFAIGTCYSEGEGVPQDDVKAFEWYSKGAAQGDAASQCALGICYSEGKGVAKDMAKAFDLWKKAAEQGNEKAKELLAQHS
ncbi:MAG: SEL1-like repeat protein [Treponema sp.]|uniref:hypothetical protein n=1 Tax=Treponema sp. TaxID=166 RepID=UPI0025EAFE3B|nr:hypothetical protein [Treponema sp.]MBQ5998255.1 SEL1-like repeat protein [Treponema sp.]MBR0496257.1 SEL1-like repeat protein [Treponema sp.]